MSRRSFITLIAAASILIILLSLVVKLASQMKKNPGKVQNQIKSNIFPLDINNKAVTATRVIYTLEGTIQEINHTKKGAQLTTDIKLANLPAIIVNQKTQVLSNNNGKISLSQVDNLKSNQKVRIYLEYGINKNIWVTSKIEILPGK